MSRRRIARSPPPEQQPSKLQRVVARLGEEFTRLGLEPRDVPMAVVLHEVVGAAVAAFLWAMCYHVRPTRHALLRGAPARLARAAEEKARASVMLAQIPGDPGRLAVALGESVALRAVIKPVTFPGKIWAAYRLTLGLKAVAGASFGGDRGGSPAGGGLN